MTRRRQVPLRSANDQRSFFSSSAGDVAHGVIFPVLQEMQESQASTTSFTIVLRHGKARAQ
eukprot:5417957-Heterocapsa_arctica.AAC.1